MTVPSGISAEPEGPAGYTYAAVLVRAERAEVRESALATLRAIRFSGWVAPVEDGWLPVVAEHAATVASGRRGVVGVGEALAEATGCPTLALRVLHDRQLVLVAWDGRDEVLRYVSDPSREPGAAHDVVPDPFGAEDADALARLCGRPEEGEELVELLAEPLDDEEEIESERLGRALRTLGMPTWLVNAWRLPRTISAGPPPGRLVRLGAGRGGVAGWVAGRGARVARRWRTPPPVLLDPPRGGTDLDDPALWM